MSERERGTATTAHQSGTESQDSIDSFLSATNTIVAEVDMHYRQVAAFEVLGRRLPEIIALRKKGGDQFREMLSEFKTIRDGLSNGTALAAPAAEEREERPAKAPKKPAAKKKATAAKTSDAALPPGLDAVTKAKYAEYTHRDLVVACGLDFGKDGKFTTELCQWFFRELGKGSAAPQLSLMRTSKELMPSKKRGMNQLAKGVTLSVKKKE